MDYAEGIVSGFVDEAVEYLPAYYNLVSLPSEAADIRTKLQDISTSLTQMIGGQMDVETAFIGRSMQGLPVQPNWKRWSEARSPRRRVNFIRHCPQQPRRWGAAPYPGAPAWGFGPNRKICAARLRLGRTN